MTQTINVMAEAHKMAKAAGSEYGHYSVRLKAAIKAVWAMIKEAAKFDATLKAVTGAVKTVFSEIREEAPQQKEKKKLFAHVYEANNSLGKFWTLRLSEPGGYTWSGQVAYSSFQKITKEEFKAECEKRFAEYKLQFD